MFFTMMTQLRGIILRQTLVSWLMMVLMLAVYIAVPYAIAQLGVFAYAEQTGFIRSLLYEWWLLLYIGGGVLGFLLMEVASYALVHRQSLTDKRPEDHARLRRLIQEVMSENNIGWRKVPRIIILPGKINAAATSSIQFGRKLLFYVPILELSDARLKAVIAHEIGHLKHWDLPARIPMLMMSIGLGLWALIPSLICMLFLFFADAFAKILSIVILGRKSIGLGLLLQCALAAFLIWYWNINVQDYIYVTGVMAILFIGKLLFKLFEKAHSRAREYLADAAAVQFVGWENRQDLANALVYIVRRVGAWEKVGKDDKSMRWFRTHPTLPDRFKALKVDIETLDEVKRAEADEQLQGAIRKMSESLEKMLDILKRYRKP